MDVTNTFTVPLPVDLAWGVLTDHERVAPCMPGAALLGVEGEDYRWLVKVKVGPVAARYQGTARFLERDEHARRAVILAEGNDLGGPGGVTARVTATLTSQGRGTAVVVNTDLDVAGRVAQFGRGVIADVSNKLFGQFVERLEDELSQEIDAAAPAAVATVGERSDQGVARRPRVDVQPIDLVAARSPGGLAKIAVPATGLGLALLALGVRLGARRRDTSSEPRTTIQIVSITLIAPNRTPDR